MEKVWLKIEPKQWKAEWRDREIDFYHYCLTTWIQPCLKLEYPTFPSHEPQTATLYPFKAGLCWVLSSAKKIWPRYFSSHCFSKFEGPATAFLRLGLLVYQEGSIQETPGAKWLIFTWGTFQPGSKCISSANVGETYRVLDKSQCKLTSDGLG